jgi:predicted PurR-regulated permease PerM
MASFFSSFLAGFVVWFFKKTAVSVYSNTLMCCSIIILIFSLLFFNLKFFVPQTFFPAVSKDFTNETALKWIASKTSDEYLPPNFKKPNNPKDVYRGQVNIQVQETLVQKVSNIVSFVGLLALFLGIILFRDRKNHKGTVSPYD